MKDPWDWTFSDLLDLVKNEVPESLGLEYKSSSALTKTNISGISKVVSSFANSAGGVIVYGIEEEDQIPKRIDEGIDPNEIQQEWLEQIINSHIQRRINGIRINKIKVPTSLERVIYVISIPQSYEAPHMADDNKYYKRFNFSSVPMQDFEVRDTSRRNSAPLLEINFNFDHNLPAPKLPSPTTDNLGRMAFNIIVTNSSDSPANYAVISIFLDKRIDLVSTGGLLLEKGAHTFRLEENYIAMIRLSMNYGLQRHLPIWKGVAFRINDNPLIVQYPKTDENISYYLGWSISSPGMELKQELVNFNVLGKNGYSMNSMEKFDEYFPYIRGDKKYLGD